MLLAILLNGMVLTTPSGHVAPICRNPGRIVTGGAPTKTSAVRPLGDEPPAQHILAVLRTDADGCVRPVVVNAKVGRR